MLYYPVLSCPVCALAPSPHLVRLGRARHGVERRRRLCLRLRRRGRAARRAVLGGLADLVAERGGDDVAVEDDEDLPALHLVADELLAVRCGWGGGCSGEETGAAASVVYMHKGGRDGRTDLEDEEAVGLDLVGDDEVVELRGEHGVEEVRAVGDDEAVALGPHALPRVRLHLLHVQHLRFSCTHRHSMRDDEQEARMAR